MVMHAVDASLAADSSQSGGVTALYALGVGLGADSSILAGLTVAYAADAAIAADSASQGDLDIFDSTVVAIGADSSMSAAALVAKLSASAILAGGFLSVDPAGVIIRRTAQSSGVPTTAKPPTIPTIRITPQAPPAPSFSVSANPPRRREDR